MTNLELNFCAVQAGEPQQPAQSHTADVDGKGEAEPGKDAKPAGFGSFGFGGFGAAGAAGGFGALGATGGAIRSHELLAHRHQQHLNLLLST